VRFREPARLDSALDRAWLRTARRPSRTPPIVRRAPPPVRAAGPGHGGVAGHSRLDVQNTLNKLALYNRSLLLRWALEQGLTD